MYVKCHRYAKESSPINLRLVEDTSVQNFIRSGMPTRMEEQQFFVGQPPTMYASKDPYRNNLLKYMVKHHQQVNTPE